MPSVECGCRRACPIALLCELSFFLPLLIGCCNHRPDPVLGSADPLDPQGQAPLQTISLREVMHLTERACRRDDNEGHYGCHCGSERAGSAAEGSWKTSSVSIRGKLEMETS